MNTPRQELLESLGHLSAMYPDLRLGQLLITVSNWATRHPDGLWDVADEELFPDAVSRAYNQSASLNLKRRTNL